MNSSSSTKSLSARKDDGNTASIESKQPYVTENPSAKVTEAANHDASSALMEIINTKSMLLNPETIIPYTKTELIHDELAVSMKSINRVTDGMIMDAQHAMDHLINVPVNYEAEEVDQDTLRKPSRGKTRETLMDNVAKTWKKIIRTQNSTTQSQTEVPILVGSKRQFHGVETDLEGEQVNRQSRGGKCGRFMVAYNVNVIQMAEVDEQPCRAQ